MKRWSPKPRPCDGQLVVLQRGGWPEQSDRSGTTVPDATMVLLPSLCYPATMPFLKTSPPLLPSSSSRLASPSKETMAEIATPARPVQKVLVLGKWPKNGSAGVPGAHLPRVPSRRLRQLWQVRRRAARVPSSFRSVQLARMRAAPAGTRWGAQEWPYKLIRSSPTSSCLADHLADIAHDVFIYARSTEVVDSLNTHHRNPKYLKGELFCWVPTDHGYLGPRVRAQRRMDGSLYLLNGCRSRIPRQLARTRSRDPRRRLPRDLRRDRLRHSDPIHAVST